MTDADVAVASAFLIGFGLSLAAVLSWRLVRAWVE